MIEASGLAGLGWTAALDEEMETYAAAGLVPGRVVAEHRAGYVVRDGETDLLCRARGRLHDEAAVGGLLPAVGDWVAFRPLDAERGIVEAVLPRRTAISRQEVFKGSEEQVLAANIDVVLLVMALDADYNVRRLERYLTTAWDTGASPVVVLTKLDLRTDRQIVVEAESVAMGVPVVAVSNLTGEGLDELSAAAGARQDIRAARLVRRRQVDAHQPAARRRPARHQQPDGRRPRPPHDPPPRAVRAARRRAADRYARPA